MNKHQGWLPRRDRAEAVGRHGDGRDRAAARRRNRPEVMILEGRQLLARILVDNPGDSGAGTLRSAIALANAAVIPVEIDFHLPRGAVIALKTGSLEISNTAALVSVVGPGADALTVDGGGTDRVLEIDPGARASISGLTITGGSQPSGFVGPFGFGGDVQNQGSLSLTGVTITGGIAFYGGGLNNTGTAVLEHCTITGNQGFHGGGLRSAGSGAMLSLLDCTFSGNGGVFASDIDNRDGLFSATGTTFAGNRHGQWGVVCDAGEPGRPPAQPSFATLTDCTFSGELGTIGTLNSYFVNMTIKDCSFVGNQHGEAMGLIGGNTSITGTTVEGNETGVAGFGGTVKLNNCLISGNVGGYGGGGIKTLGSALSLTGCTISGNQAYYGGGVNLGGTSSATIAGCTISGNEAPTASYGYSAGGGVFVSPDSSATLVDCTITGNRAPQGGGIFNTASNGLALIACTVSGNTASSPGGGGGLCQTPYNSPYYSVDPSSTLTDTIIAGNAGPAGASDIEGQSAGNITGSYNLIGTGGSGGLSAADHNLLNVADPGLAPLGDYGGPTETMALQPDSPARHAGTAVPGVTTDQRGFPLDGPPDSGAFQSHPGPLVVDTAIDGLGSGPGQLSLRQAINLSNVLNGGDSITFDKSAFAGKSVITLTAGQLELSDATGPVAILGPGLGKLAIRGGGSGRVFQVDMGTSASLSGLTISGGVTDGDGGGLLNQGKVTLSGVAVVGNSAANGGGVANSGTAVFLGSSIDGNSAKSDGGGIFNTGGLSMTLSDLSGNSAGIDGGGLDNRGTAALVFCTVADNLASSGGGIYADASGQPVVLLGTQVKRNQGSNITGRVIRL